MIPELERVGQETTALIQSLSADVSPLSDDGYAWNAPLAEPPERGLDECAPQTLALCPGFHGDEFYLSAAFGGT